MSDTLSAGAIATGQEDKIRQRAYELWENEGRAGSPKITGSGQSVNSLIRSLSVLTPQERVPHPLPQLRWILPRLARSRTSGLRTSLSDEVG